MHAALHDAALAPLEALGLRAQRHELLAMASGRVLEVGAGTGHNLTHYRPDRVTSVVACEPDAARRHRLEARARSAPVPVEVVAGAVPGLRMAPASFDTVVCTLVLCTVADAPAAAAEIRALVRPGGRLLFLEHIIGRSPLFARVQRAVTPYWTRLAGGCRLDRDTIATLRAAGWVISDCERLAPLGRISAGMVVRGDAIPRSTP